VNRTVWIPYTADNRKEQEREMDRLLSSGRYEYKDAKVVEGADGERCCVWVLGLVEKKKKTPPAPRFAISPDAERPADLDVSLSLSSGGGALSLVEKKALLFDIERI